MICCVSDYISVASTQHTVAVQRNPFFITSASDISDNRCPGHQKRDTHGCCHTFGNAEHGGKFFHRVLLLRVKLLTESGGHRVVSEPVHEYMTGFMCKNKPPFPKVLLLPQVLINYDKSFGRYNRYSLTVPPK